MPCRDHKKAAFWAAFFVVPSTYTGAAAPDPGALYGLFDFADAKSRPRAVR